MISDKIVPAHILAGYVWELWKNNSNVSNIIGRDGEPLARMAPVQDEPDLADSGETYMIYGFSENESNELPVLHTGTLSFRIIAKNFAEMTQILQLLLGAFELEDVAANAVNVWSSEKSSMHGIRFGSVCMTYMEAADAATTEGGKIEAIANLTYKYVIQSSVKIYRGNGIWS